MSINSIMSQTSNSLECGVCSNEFSDDHCPMILECSHTFCATCIDEIITTHRRKACPFCRRTFRARSARDLVINRNLLDVSKQLSSKSAESETSSSADLKKTFLEFIKDFREKSTQKGIADCRQSEGQLTEAIRSYYGIKAVTLEASEEIKRLKKTLEEMEHSNEGELSDIDETIILLKNKLQAIRNDKKIVQDADAKLAAATDFMSVEPIIGEAEKSSDGVQKDIKETQEFLQKKLKERDNTVEKVFKTKARLSDIGEELDKRPEDVSTINITVNDLRSLKNPLKNIVHRQIFAVRMFEGKMRLAVVESETDNLISLSHLQEGYIPPNSFIIKLKQLMSIPTQRAFLDLGVDGIFIGRILIKVMDKGNKALNFLHMCAGDLGPSYVGFQVLGRYRQDREGENIGVGTYGEKGRILGKSLLPEIDWEKEAERVIYKMTSPKVGEVRGWFSYERASRFYIVLRDYPNWIDNCCFGVVEDGLHVLKNPNILKAKIMNCGLIFSL